MTTMMKCGHAANSVLKDTGKPACVICAGLVAGWDEPAGEPDLTGRTARCYCGKTVPSERREMLAFFAYRPEREHDEFYCGHNGWD